VAEMSKKQVLILALMAFGLLLAVVPLPAFVLVISMTLGGGVVVGTRATRRWWKERQFLQKAQYVSDISQVGYFRRVPKDQLENWVFLSLTARRFVLLGDPILVRSHAQGYAWRDGKKAVVVIQLERALMEDDLRRIYTVKSKFQVENVIIVSPFPKAPRTTLPGFQILAGKDLLRWMSVLHGVKPTNLGNLPIQFCSCGAQQVEQVSRGGEPLLVCSQYPDCQKVERPAPVKGIVAATTWNDPGSLPDEAEQLDSIFVI